MPETTDLERVLGEIEEGSSDRTLLLQLIAVVRAAGMYRKHHGGSQWMFTFDKMCEALDALTGGGEDKP